MTPKSPGGTRSENSEPRKVTPGRDRVPIEPPMAPVVVGLRRFQPTDSCRTSDRPQREPVTDPRCIPRNAWVLASGR
jgi:hypothetical protein